MSRTPEQFVQSLVRSGVMSADEVRAFQQGLGDAEADRDAQGLARALVQAGKLTKYQAHAIYKDKWQRLVLGEYVVLEKIGAGGMGQVFKARHRRMDRLAAVKLLPASATASAEAVERFHREMKAAARLNHSNIVTAYDASEQDGVHYLVMEYVDGQDLAALCRRRGALPLAEALDYVLQAARGLEYAHQQGVTHRDIKPNNLLLDTGGVVKVLDMGLARIESSERTAEEGLTRSGQVMGTVDYMPPEQAESTRQADQRSDVYSLGCTFYRLATGRIPYEGETVMSKLMALAKLPVPRLADVLDEAPAALDEAIGRMMAKDPADRPQTMSEAIELLESCRGHLDGSDPGAPDVAPLEEAEEFPLGMLEEALEATPAGGATQTEVSEPNRAAAFVPPAVTAPRPRGQKNQKLLVFGIAGAGGLLLLILVLVFAGAFSGGAADGVAADGDAADGVAADAAAVADTGAAGDGTGDDGSGGMRPVSAGVDLLALAQTADAPNRDWRRDGAALTVTSAGLSLLPLRYGPPEEYRLEVELTRTSGSGAVLFGLVAGGQQFHAIIDYSDEHWSGLALIDGRETEPENATAVRGARRIINGRSYTVAITVRDARITMSIDGTQLVDFTGARSRISRSPNMRPITDQRCLFLGITASSFQFTRVQLTPLRGEGRALVLR